MNSFTILNLHSILFQHYLCLHFPTYKIGIVWEIPILFPNTFEQCPTKRGQILRYITSTSLMIWNGSYAHTLSNILHIVFLYLLSSSVRRRKKLLLLFLSSSSWKLFGCGAKIISHHTPTHLPVSRDLSEWIASQHCYSTM